ncbi:MAG: hypothetical protein WCI73_18540, partial [Phycisphaerae bacterium]
VWEGRLLSDAIDEQIAAKLGLPFETRTIDLADEDEAKLWIVERILEVPDLNTFQRVRGHLQHKSLLVKYGRTRMVAAAQGLSLITNPPAPHDSRGEIAKASGVSGTQVFKVEYLLEHADTALLAQLEAGETKIGTAYESLQTMGDPEPDGLKYNLLYLDLPTGLGAKRLRNLPLSDLAAENASLFVWAHPCDLIKMLSLVRKWEFRYVTHFILPLGKGPVRGFVQEHHDVLIFATRGEVAEPAIEDLPSTLLAETAGPDRPDAVFLMIEKLFPNTTKVQILSRAPRAGWQDWDFRGRDGIGHGS